MSLKMFIKGLTSDINRLQAFKKNKSKREEIEKILADSFLMLSEIVSDRVSLAREAVLTGFSIVPSQEMLDKIIEFAAISGLDKLDNEEVEVENIEEVVEHASGLPICRVTAVGKFSRAKTKSQIFSGNSVETFLKDLNTGVNLENIFQNLSSQMMSQSYGKADTKLKRNKKKKKFRNLEGLLAIQVRNTTIK